MATAIAPFGDEHLERAASLVAARYRAERRHIPALPAAYEDPDAIGPRLRELAQSAPGVVAIREGQLAGFLLAYLALPRGVRTAYVPDFGHGADAVGGREIYRTMYASLSHKWLAHGCFSHCITFLAHEREAIEAWFSLGFGLIVIDALRDLDPGPGPSADAEIRRATAADVDLLTPLMLDLGRHLAASPIFIPLIVEDGRKDLERWLSDPARALWLAFQDGDVVAFMRLEPSRCEVMPTSADTTVAITGAFTVEKVRSRGIGTALLDHALDWARSAGYAHCSVDFESANIPGSRFWLGKGFQPVCHSLARRVDERLAWAHERRDDGDLVRAYEGRTGVG
jgi:GNAT superfamily N-acetyltransferase